MNHFYRLFQKSICQIVATTCMKYRLLLEYGGAMEQRQTWG